MWSRQDFQEEFGLQIEEASALPGDYQPASALDFPANASEITNIKLSLIGKVTKILITVT